MRYEVTVAEYIGNGHWSDGPPYVFDDKKEAENFAKLINATAQVGGRTKARDIIERAE